MIDVPVIETERLILRGWREDDLDSYAAMLADPEVTQFLLPCPSRHDAWRTLSFITGHWAIRGYGFWAVERKADHALLGRVGLFNPEGWPAVELGWALARHAWGDGYATEASRAAMDFGFAQLNLGRLVSHIDPKNTRSQAVARRLQQSREQFVDFDAGFTRVTADSWEITRDAWKSLPDKNISAVTRRYDHAAVPPMMRMNIPVIETERLVLRGYRDADFEPFAAIMADPEVGRFLSGPQNRGTAWRSFADVLGHWALRGHGFWAVERKEGGAFLGRIGLNRPETWPGMEVGWTLGSRYWGKGHATEAGRAAMDHGFRNYPLDRLISLIDPENRPSQKVAERLGFRRGAPWTELAYNGRTFRADVWEMTRENWENRGQSRFSRTESE